MCQPVDSHSSRSLCRGVREQQLRRVSWHSRCLPQHRHSPTVPMSCAQSALQGCSHGSWLEPSSRENSAVSLVALSVCLLSHVCVNLTLFYCYTEHLYYSFLIRKCALFIRAQVVLCMLKCVLHGVFVLFKTLCMYVYICIYTHSVPSQMMAVVQH